MYAHNSSLPLYTKPRQFATDNRLILYRTHDDWDNSPNSEHDIHHNNYWATSDFDMLQRVSLGVWMYTVYAELSQRPRVLMRESGNPRNAAVVAAPIRKLWPEYLVSSTLCLRRAARTDETKRSRVKYLPSANVKNGPGDVPLSTI